MYHYDCIRYGRNCKRQTNRKCPVNCSGYVSGTYLPDGETGPRLEQRPDMLTGRRNGMKRVSG